jgi:hypothetical protein
MFFSQNVLTGLNRKGSLLITINLRQEKTTSFLKSENVSHAYARKWRMVYPTGGLDFHYPLPFLVVGLYKLGQKLRGWGPGGVKGELNEFACLGKLILDRLAGWLPVQTSSSRWWWSHGNSFLLPLSYKSPAELFGNTMALRSHPRIKTDNIERERTKEN